MAQRQKTGGRKRGTPNRVTLSVKQAVLDTFSALGGAKHMTKWARKNPSEFYRIAAKLVPPGGPVAIDSLTGSLVEQGQAVLAALTEGRVTPDEAASLMQAVAAQAKIIEVDDLVRRVKALEETKNAATRQ